MDDSLRFEFLTAIKDLQRVRPMKNGFLGIPFNEFIILRHIGDLLVLNPELRVSALRDEAGISMPAISQSLGQLEKKGLVVRSIDPKDRRAVLISLSQEGEELLRASHSHAEENTSLILSRFGEEKTRQLISLFREMHNILNEIQEEKQNIN